MALPANDFYNSIPNANDLSQKELVDYFIYFLTVDLAETVATVSSIRNCFSYCDILPPTHLATQLSKGLKTSPPKYIKVDGGYRLHRHLRESITNNLSTTINSLRKTKTDLRQLEQLIAPSAQKGFLSETLTCFEVGAYRATILMMWLLTLDHLFEYVLKNRLSEFNLALSKNTDKRVKIQSVSVRDDFSEMPESKFIEFCKSAKIISSDVRKILDQKLATRNSAAHPSTIIYTESKIVEYVEDLVENVVKRYVI
jgi:hypothetical protein